MDLWGHWENSLRILKNESSRHAVSLLSRSGWTFFCAAEVAELLTGRECRLQLYTGSPAVRADVASKTSFLPVAAAMVTSLRQLAIISIYIAEQSHSKQEYTDGTAGQLVTLCYDGTDQQILTS
jgi:hypothetical protein